MLEVCCGTLEDALAAEAGGADRVELCAALELDGLTPSLGTVMEARERLDIPVVVMLRPRTGDFRYGRTELATMRRDADLALTAGADGIVFGMLARDGSVDEGPVRAMVEIADGADTVFHRAFDQAPDPAVALETLIALGVSRVLTSGGAPTALEGAAGLRALVEQAAGRIEILAGGGIREPNVEEIVRTTGVTQVHLRR